jgi:hypothetical protein
MERSGVTNFEILSQYLSREINEFQGKTKDSLPQDKN